MCDVCVRINRKKKRSINASSPCEVTNPSGIVSDSHNPGGQVEVFFSFDDWNRYHTKRAIYLLNIHISLLHNDLVECVSLNAFSSRIDHHKSI